MRLKGLAVKSYFPLSAEKDYSAACKVRKPFFC